FIIFFIFFFSSRRRHTRWPRDWSSDVCSSDLKAWTNKIPLEAFGYTVDEFRQLRHRSIYVRDAIRNGLGLDESGSWQTKRRGVGSGRIIRPVTKSDQMKGRD